MGIELTDDERAMALVIVDDDPDVCKGLDFAFKHQLRLTQFRSFTEPHEALAYFKKHAATVDVVLLDLKMPEIDGMEMLTRIRDLDSAIQVVVLSAYADKASTREVLTMAGLPEHWIVVKAGSGDAAPLADVLREAYHLARTLRTGDRP